MKKNIIDKEIGIRFTKFRETLNLAQHELASELWVVQPLISKIESGKCNPNLGYLSYLYKEYRLNINWLISGQGEMFLKEERQIKRYKKYFELLKFIRVPVIELQILAKLAEVKVILKDNIKNYKNISLKNEINI